MELEQQYIPITHKRLFPYTKTLRTCSFRSCLYGKHTLENQSGENFNYLGFRAYGNMDIDVNFDNYSRNNETVRNKRIFKEYNVFSYGKDDVLYNYSSTGLGLASISSRYYRNRL